LRDALELVGGIHAAAARFRQASYRTPLRKLRDDARASFGLRGSCLTNHTLSELRDCGGETCA